MARLFIESIKVLILLSDLKVSLCVRSVQVNNCNTTIQHSSNYSETKHELLIATFFTADDPYQWLRTWGGDSYPVSVSKPCEVHTKRSRF